MAARNGVLVEASRRRPAQGQARRERIPCILGGIIDVSHEKGVGDAPVSWGEGPAQLLCQADTTTRFYDGKADELSRIEPDWP